MRVILRMTIALATSNLVRAGLGFLAAIVIARGLGTAAFGQWTFCMAWASTLTTIADLGFGVLLTRDAARSPAGLGTVVGGAVVARAIALLPIGIAMVIAASWIGGDVVPPDTLRIVVPLAVAGALYGCIAAVFRAWPEWLPAILIVESVGAALQLIGSLAILGRPNAIANLLWLATAVQIAQMTAAAWLWQASRSRHDRLARPTLGDLYHLLRRSLPFAAAGIVANAQARVAPLALGYLATANDVALFGVAQRLGGFVRVLPQSAFAGALPVIAGEMARGETGETRRGFDRAVIAFAVVSALALALFAPIVVTLTYGQRFSAAAPVLMWVAVGLGPGLVNGARRIYLWAAGREQLATAWNAVAVVVQIVMSVALIPTFGAPGAAIAIALGELAIVWPLHRGHRAIEIRERAGGPVGVVRESPIAGC